MYIEILDIYTSSSDKVSGKQICEI